MKDYQCAMKLPIGIACILVAASTVAQTPRITAECNEFLTQQLRQGAKIDQVLEVETIDDMTEAAWTECRTAALAYLEARRKAVEERERRKAERQKQKRKVGEFVKI